MTAAPWDDSQHTAAQALAASHTVRIVYGDGAGTELTGWSQGVYTHSEQAVPACTLTFTVNAPTAEVLALDPRGTGVKVQLFAGWDTDPATAPQLVFAGWLTENLARTDEDGLTSATMRAESDEVLWMDEAFWGPSNWTPDPARLAGTNAIMFEDPTMERPTGANWPSRVVIDPGVNLSGSKTDLSLLELWAVSASGTVTPPNLWDYYVTAAEMMGAHVSGHPEGGLWVLPWNRTTAPLRPTLSTGAAGYVTGADRAIQLREWADSILLSYSWAARDSSGELVNYSRVVVSRGTSGRVHRLKEVRRRAKPGNNSMLLGQASAMRTRLSKRGTSWTLTGRAAWWIRASDRVPVSNVPGLASTTYYVSGIQFDLDAGLMTLDLRSAY